ncbi:hypothetical protein [Actinacidiphila yeochonensis]|uniref:hypothetical protein n=1 Tax=Actinacidiphila yeochonensis TaxID=89050 RepID=UPI00056D3BC9|nr:hypothetical protein [Actinacidiphila yeochonensis]
MFGGKFKALAGVVAAGALALVVGASAAPASAVATPPDGAVTLYSGVFSGQSQSYTPAPGCTALPFAAHAEFNFSPVGFSVYQSTDCTGPALYFPTNDFHDFTDFDGRSIQFAS